MPWIRTLLLTLACAVLSVAQTSSLQPITLIPKDPGLADNAGQLYIRQPSVNDSLDILPVDSLVSSTETPVLAMGFSGNTLASNLDLNSSFLAIVGADPLANIYLGAGIIPLGPVFAPSSEIGCLLGQPAPGGLPSIDIPFFAIPAGGSLYLQLITSEGGNLKFSDGLTLVSADPVGQALNSASLNGEVAHAMVSGDLNGDSIDDLVVGLPLARVTGLPDAGQLLIFLGTPSGLSTVPYIIEEPDLTPFFPTGTQPFFLRANNRFASSLLIADVNGAELNASSVLERIPDLIVGAINSPAIGANPLDPPAGAVYTIDGSFLRAQMLAPPAVPTLIVPSAVAREVRTLGINPSSPAPLFPASSSHFGWDLATGDFDGDGNDDVVVSAATSDGPLNEGGAGATYLYLNAQDPSYFTPSSQIFANPNALLFAPTSEAAPGALFGYALASADFFGAGQDQLVVSAPGANSGGGLVTVFTWDGLEFKTHQTLAPQVSDRFGVRLATGDLSGDGIPSLAVSSRDWDGADGTVVSYDVAGGSVLTQAQVLNGFSSFPNLGEALLIADLNEDGIGDLIAQSARPLSTEGNDIIAFFGSAAPIGSSRFQRLVLNDSTAAVFGFVLASGSFQPGAAPSLVSGNVGGPAPLTLFHDLLGRDSNALAPILPPVTPLGPGICP